MSQKIFGIVFTLFCFNSTLNAYEITKGTKLLDAVSQQNFEKVKKLMDSGVDVNEKGKVGFTPLITATGWGDLKIVKYLINHGAEVNATTNKGTSVIHYSSINKDPSVLKFMLKNFKLNVNDKTKTHCSPLDFSLRMNALQDHGTLDNTRLLLENGAKKSINWTCRGYTPLMVSIPDKKVINFLIDNGADKNVKNKFGFTAYDMAKKQNAPTDILEILATSKKETDNKKESNKLIFEGSSALWELKTTSNNHQRYTEEEAVKYCEDLTIEKYKDWHIPSVAEYKSILSKEPYKGYVIDGIETYYMNPKDFPNMSPTSYWVKLENKSLGSVSTSWNQFHNKRGKNDKHNIRCVHKK